jgi:hypothetical protein
MHASTHTHTHTQTVWEYEDVRVVWNQSVNTDREVTDNRPHKIIKREREKMRTLQDVAVPVDRNVTQKEAEKKLKYKILCIVIQRMWNTQCTTVPVITEATGKVTKGLKKNVEAIPGKHRFATKDSYLYSWNVTHNMESTVV